MATHASWSPGIAFMPAEFPGDMEAGEWRQLERRSRTTPERRHDIPGSRRDFELVSRTHRNSGHCRWHAGKARASLRHVSLWERRIHSRQRRHDCRLQHNRGGRLGRGEPNPQVWSLPALRRTSLPARHQQHVQAADTAECCFWHRIGRARLVQPKRTHNLCLCRRGLRRLNERWPQRAGKRGFRYKM